MKLQVRAARDRQERDFVVPRHVAIIMDGNGRWAMQRRHRRVFGHRQGASTVREITRESARLGVGWLTLYAFSTENWKRPAAEISALMKLLRRYLIQERAEIMDNNIRFTVIGRIEALPEDVRKEIAHLKGISKDNSGMTLCLALNYGGREEITEAMKRLAQEVAEGKRTPQSLTADDIRRCLYAPEAPDPDLLIRTAGEMRISNFLLWQVSYAELYVTPVLWPEFGVEQLHEALREYSRRERRFGGLPPNDSKGAP